MGGRGYEETCQAVLRDMWVLGEGEMYEVWWEGLCFGVLDFASAGMLFEIWGIKGMGNDDNGVLWDG